MAKLTTAKRKAIPTSQFAGPDRSYPIHDRSHAANAKARVSNKSPALKAKVDAAVARKYPDMGKRSDGDASSKRAKKLDSWARGK
jgi:hypothetical protein